MGDEQDPDEHDEDNAELNSDDEGDNILNNIDEGDNILNTIDEGATLLNYDHQDEESGSEEEDEEVEGEGSRVNGEDDEIEGDGDDDEDGDDNEDRTIVANDSDDSDDSDDDDEEEETCDELKPLKEVPAPISLKNHVYDVAFHPTKSFVATAEITGKVTLFNYSVADGNKKLFFLRNHKQACRSIEFSRDGSKLFACSKDKSISCVDMNTGALQHTIPSAHTESINKLKVMSENYLASGCDGGTVKVWDTRTFSSLIESSDCSDFISDMQCDKEMRHLLCTSGDGHLLVYNTRKKQLERRSDQLEEELLSLAIMKRGEKVVCGGGTGTLNIYAWNEWADVSDRLPTASESVESICPVTEDLVCIGGDDGVIRCLQIQPHRAIGVLGRHGSFPIDNLRLSPDGETLASCSGDQTVRFWDVSGLAQYTPPEDKPMQKRKERKRKLDVNESAKDNFFADL